MVLLKSFLITLALFLIAGLLIAAGVFIVDVYGAYGVMGILITAVFVASWAFIYDVVQVINYKKEFIQILADYRAKRIGKAHALQRIAQVVEEAQGVAREDIEREAEKAVEAL